MASDNGGAEQPAPGQRQAQNKLDKLGAPTSAMMRACPGIHLPPFPCLPAHEDSINVGILSMYIWLQRNERYTDNWFLGWVYLSCIFMGMLWIFG